MNIKHFIITLIQILLLGSIVKNTLDILDRKASAEKYNKHISCKKEGFYITLSIIIIIALLFI